MALKIKVLAVLLALVSLTGCISAEEERARQEKICADATEEAGYPGGQVVCMDLVSRHLGPGMRPCTFGGMPALCIEGRNEKNGWLFVYSQQVTSSFIIPAEMRPHTISHVFFFGSGE